METKRIFMAHIHIYIYNPRNSEYVFEEEIRAFDKRSVKSRTSWQTYYSKSELERDLRFQRAHGYLKWFREICPHTMRSAIEEIFGKKKGA